MTTKPATALGVVVRQGRASDGGSRRHEILETAAALIATSGLRTSMQDIGRAAGIQTGSLYHHFESKEALLVELLRRYHEDLDIVAAQALGALEGAVTPVGFDEVAVLSTALAQCAVAHSAAIQISMYETPSSSPDLVEWTTRRPTAVFEAMHETLRAAARGGVLRSDIDLAVLTGRFVSAMLQVGLHVIRQDALPEQVARLLCRLILNGLAVSRPTNTQLDRSDAFLAANRAISSWADEPADKDLAAHIRAVARTEFGRRGFEGTTVREIAAAAGIGHGTVFRLVGSKEQLLASIVGGFGAKTEKGSREVLRTNSSPVEKLDALSWVYINSLHRFGDEFRIQLAWMRESPPDTPHPSVEFPIRLKQTKRLLGEGVRTGAITSDPSARDLLARNVIGLQWLPEEMVQSLGPRASLLHVRDTLLRGAAVPRATMTN